MIYENKYLDAACKLLSQHNEFNMPGNEGYQAAELLVNKFRSTFSTSFDGQILGIPINLMECDQGNVLVRDLFVVHEISLLLKIKLLSQSGKFKNFLDFGANIGLYSIFASKLNFNVKSFEPDPSTYEILKQNIDNNSLNQNNIIINNEAIWSSTTQKSFVRVVDNNTASGISDSGKNFYGETIKFNVNCRNVNEVLESNSIVKIDVEGSELEIFKTIDWENFINIALFIEIGSEEARSGIFNICLEKKLEIRSQLIGWGIAENDSQLPLSWRDGSVMVLKK